jgi:hypothetical protein
MKLVDNTERVSAPQGVTGYTIHLKMVRDCSVLAGRSLAGHQCDGILLNLVDTEQVSGLNTRTDALYFTLVTMATVGFGDIHAEGQFARAMVICLIVPS